MRLLNTAPYTWPRHGGMENYTTGLLCALIKEKRYEVLSVSASWDTLPTIRELPDAPVPTVQLPHDFKIFSTPVGIDWRRRIREIAREFGPDVIVSHTPVPYMADVTSIVARSLGVPFVLAYYNEMKPPSGPRKFLAPIYEGTLGALLLNSASRIMILTPVHAESSHALRKHVRKLVVVPPGVDVEFFHHVSDERVREKYHLPKGDVVLFVGQLERFSNHKGMPILMRAFKRVLSRHPGACLVVAGSGSGLASYRQMAADLGIGRNASFLGSVDTKDLPGLYSTASVLVLPSTTKSEGLGLVLIEAQACGTPVVASSVGGIPFAMVHGETGLLVPPNDESALAEAILRTCEDAGFQGMLKTRGPAFVREKFSWMKAAERVDAMIQEILGGAR